MAYPNVVDHDDVVMAVIKGKAEDQAIVNTAFYRVKQNPVVPGATLDITIVAEEAYDRFVAQVVPLLNQVYVTESCTVYTLTNATVVPGGKPKLNFDFIGVWTPATPDQGGVAGASLPCMIAASCQKKTGIPTRRSKGSARIGPISESDTAADGNALAAGPAAAFTTAVNNWLKWGVALPAPNAAWSCIGVVYSAANNAGIPTATPLLASNDITSVTVSEYVGSQLSRKKLNKGN